MPPGPIKCWKDNLKIYVVMESKVTKDDKLISARGLIRPG